MCSSAEGERETLCMPTRFCREYCIATKEEAHHRIAPMVIGKSEAKAVTGAYRASSLHAIDCGLCFTSRSSSEAEEKSTSRRGDKTESPRVVSFSWRMPTTAGLPPLKDASNVESEWMRSRGPSPKDVSGWAEGMQIITSASELAMSKSFVS